MGQTGIQRHTIAQLAVCAMTTAAIAITAAIPACGQTVAEFYRGKIIEPGISSSVGGGQDAHGRLLARHMPKYLPELRADARKARLEINPVAGNEVHALVTDLYATPAPVVQKAAELLK
jgi:hypothetical protein